MNGEIFDWWSRTGRYLEAGFPPGRLTIWLTSQEVGIVGLIYLVGLRPMPNNGRKKVEMINYSP